MSKINQQTEQPLDIAQAIETYRLWCFRNGKEFIQVDTSKIEVVSHKGKPALILRSTTGGKLARLRILESGFVVSWINFFVSPNYKSGKKKYTVPSYQ